METKPPPFTGNTACCFANSLAMALAHRGDPVSANLVEALTLVGLGADWEPAPDGPLLFFSGAGLNPDTGRDHALSVLGYAWQGHWTARDAGDPRESLAMLDSWLRSGPVVVGPVEMDKLVYLPHAAGLAGVDHYVLVYGLDAERVLLHDPAGYPCVALPIDRFVEAWRATAIAYRRGNFQMWSGFARVTDPAPAAMAKRAVSTIAACLTARGATGSPAARDGAAIRQLTAMVRADRLAPALHGHLVWFALPLGARRALDLAGLLDLADDSRAAIKRAQAAAVGAAHTALMTGNRGAAADALVRVADLDDAFAAATLYP